MAERRNKYLGDRRIDRDGKENVTSMALSSKPSTMISLLGSLPSLHGRSSATTEQKIAVNHPSIIVMGACWNNNGEVV